MRSRWCLLLPVAVGAVSRTRGAAARGADTLTAIQHRLDEESTEDKDIFDKLGCWCQTNLADKQQTVEQMQQDNTALGHDIEAQTAENARLNAELETHNNELQSNQQALDEATAMREKDASKFADEEESHQQTLSSLDDAMGSLKESHGHEAELSMAALFSTQSGASAGMFLQLKTALKNKQSPEVVFGVLKHMKNTFGEELKDIQHNEANMKTDHEALVGAKSQEINALKKQIQSKNNRYATGKVQVAQKSEQVERSQALLDADIQLLNGMKELCQNNDDSFQSRQSDRQAEIQSLASALVDVAGDSLLAVNTHGQQPAEWGGPADELCMTAMSIVDEDWRAKAKQACEKARKGGMPDAADAVESLEDEIKEAQQKIANEKAECGQEMDNAQQKATAAKEQTDTEENLINSDKDTSAADLAAVNAQGSGAEKAKESVTAADAAQHEVMQKIRAAAVHDEDVLEKLKKSVGASAASKIQEAIENANKLSAGAISFDENRNTQVQKVSELLDGVQRMAGKAAIPLQMMHAEDEEASLKVRDDREADAHLKHTSCNMQKITTREQQLSEYAAKLSKAAESLAWNSLR